MLTRRGLITGLASLVAAPAIVRAANIMPVCTVQWTRKHEFTFIYSPPRLTLFEELCRAEMDEVIGIARGEIGEYVGVRFIEEAPFTAR